MRIYLDKCADSNLLANFLQQAGHVVQTPRAANKIRVDDSEQLKYAAQNQYVLLTFNPKDFLNLHQQWQQQNRSHSGILLVYRDNDVTRDMRYVDIVRAINRLLIKIAQKTLYLEGRGMKALSFFALNGRKKRLFNWY